MYNQQYVHYQQGINKPIQFRDERFANHAISDATFLPNLMNRSSRYRAPEKQDSTFISFHLVALCHSSDRMRLIRDIFILDVDRGTSSK